MPDGTRTSARDAFLTLGDNGINLPLLVAQLRTSIGVTPFVGAGMSVPFGMPDWRSFLLRLAPDDATRASIERRLSNGEYEEAAQDLIDLRGRNTFQDVLEVTFGENVVMKPTPDAAARLIPALASGPVITTNFDFILERVFASAGRPFDGVVNGMRVDDLRKVLHERRHALVHVHGTAGDRTDRVLTLEEYRQRYQTDAPLEALLQLLATQPILFLGCSLEKDRPVRALRAYAEQLRARNAEALLAHFAVLEYPADAGRRAARIADLAAIGVRPIWFPTGQFALIREVLAYLVEERTRSGMDAKVAPYAQALLSSFRLDGAGLALDGASAHARALAQAYGGAQYAVGRDTLSLDRLIEQRRRLVLLGEPGSGKSVTLKRALAFFHDRLGLVPVYLRLADFAAAQPSGDEIPPARFFQAFAERAAALGAPGCDAPFFEALVRQGRASLALDGFDEIGSRSQRERVAAAIGRLSEVTPDGRLLVASRPGAFRATPLPHPIDARIDPFAEGEALPFGSTQVRGFLRDCFGDDGTLWRTIEGDDRLRGLATTPLLVTLLALLARRGPLPEGLSAIFGAVIDTAIVNWEAAKATGQAPGIHPSVDARRALEELAFAMHQRETPAEPMPEREALRAIGNDSTLLEWLVNRTGLLLKVQQRGVRSSRTSVQMAHLQLQEFLAGVALAHRLAADEAGIATVLKSVETSDNWRQPLIFAAAELVRLDEHARLERWIEDRMRDIASNPTQSGRSALLSGHMLAEADAHFLPATSLEANILSALYSRRADFLVEWIPGVYESAFCSFVGPLIHRLAPRVEAIRLAREIALQSTEGVAWLELSSSAWQNVSEVHWDAYDMLAACVDLVCRYGTSLDARAATSSAMRCAQRLRPTALWVHLAGYVRQFHGEGHERSYLRGLIVENSVLKEDRTVPVGDLLSAVARTDSPELARVMAHEQVRGDVASHVAVATVLWLESQDDKEAASWCDDYYERLRVEVVRRTEEYRWRGGQLPLWPARDSVATDALRRAALSSRDTAWFVIRDAALDARYATEWRAAWIDIVLHDADDSRRRSLIHDIAQLPRHPQAAELLLTALDADQPLGRVGFYIVRQLVAIGEGERLTARLAELHAAPSISTAHREAMEFLQRLATEQMAERVATTGGT